jgi:hypothetical protein
MRRGGLSEGEAGSLLQGFPYRDNLTGIIIPVRTSLLAFWFNVLIRF